MLRAFLLSTCALVAAVHADAAQLFAALPANHAAAVRAGTDASFERLRAQPTTRSATAVAVDAAALRDGVLTIDLATGLRVEAHATRVERRGADGMLWTGELAGGRGNVTLVLHGNRLTGSVRADKQLYRIVPLKSGAHALVNVDVSRLPPDHPADAHYKMDRQVPARTAARISPEAAVIDVLVTYTPAANDRVDDMQALIELAVAETNQAYENSQIEPRIRLVYQYMADYNEKGKSYDRMKDDLSGKDDAYMPEVHKRRKKYGADVVVLIAHAPDACGSADAIMANAATAFVVVHWDCATGYYSFAHEIGHLQGARHDPDTDSTNTPFKYGHGYRYNNDWRTIMAYDCPGDCPRLQYFSNPNVNYEGTPMGNTKRSNNARVLNETQDTIAGFMPTKVP